MIIRLFGAFIRATLVALLWLAPSIVLPNATSEAVVLTALLLFLFVFFEYSGKSPSFIEFRFTHGFNLFRFALLCILVGAVCLVCLEHIAIVPLSDTLGRMLDFAGSPVRFMIVLVGDVGPEAAVVLTITLLFTLCFCLLLLVLPGLKQPRFNLWKNLPNTPRSPIAMHRGGWVNIVLGVALFYLLPFILGLLAITPHTHAGVWAVILWAFTPAMLIIRGTALLKLSRSFA